MKDPKYYIVIFIFLIMTNCILGQQENIDVKDHYFGGRINYKHGELKRSKNFKEKTILLQLKYKNGSILKEYFRINDSTFLYSEYFDSGKSDTYWNSFIRKEGYLGVTNRTTGDTITIFDYDTYEEKVYLDTLLLPTGKWKYYYPNGRLMQEGEFKSHKRNGDWRYFDEYRRPTKIVQYQNGEIDEVVFLNKILKNSSITTAKFIIGNWILRPSYNNGIQESEAELDTTNILYKINKTIAIGDMFSFDSENNCLLQETNLVRTKRKGKESNIIGTINTLSKYSGTYKLIDTNIIEIQIKGQSNTFRIEYLSDTKMGLIKEKALNNR